MVGEAIETSPEENVVLSYMDVFHNYYDYACEADETFSEKYSFEDYVDGYYDNSLNIGAYTSSLMENRIIPFSSSSSSSSGSYSGGIKGEDEYYILKDSTNSDDSVTPASYFARQPLCK